MAERLNHLSELVQQAVSGNGEVQQVLINSFEPRIRRYVATRIPDPDPSDTVVQTTLSKIGLNLFQFDPGLHDGRIGVRFTNWCFTITRNETVNALRRKSIEERVSFAPRRDIVQFIPDYEDRIAEILPSITEPRREVVELVISGKSIGEVAKELSIAEQNVRQRLHRGREVIEQFILEPSGLVRLARFKNPRLYSAIRHDKADGVKFLGSWYTTEEVAQKYPKAEETRTDVQAI